jgi:Predicted membrane protein
MDTKKLARLALLTTLALIIFMVEAQIPNPIPIPGAKLGLANIITVYAIFRYSAKETALMLFARILLGSMFSGNLMSLFYSLTGGLFCFLVMLLVKRVLTLEQIWVCSILGSLAHNAGQILIAMLITGSWRMIFYFPPLILSGILAGLFTGLLAQYLVNRKAVA